MLHSIRGRSSRVLLAAILALSALHCGQTAPPADEGSGGTGGGNLGGQGGDPGAGGSGGGSTEGGANSVSVTELSIRSTDRVDMLFVIDNSVSMADKQALLVQAVPKLIERLMTPGCIDLQDGERTPSDDRMCPLGSTLEIDPVDDLHIGVISSSLGGFGTGMCTGDDDADKSQLIPKVRSGAPDPGGLGFLAWSGGDAAAVTVLKADFVGQLGAVGETGCGFEAPLEAWYRFLVDPSPPAGLERNGSNETVSTGVDEAILEQRAQFLRPDSLVGIVMLTDEDDCSAMEGGGYYPNAAFGWLVPEIQRTFATASPECAANPNDACCFSCLQQAPPDGCTDTCERDSEGRGVELALEDDRANVRCFQGQRRFGIDLLYPVSRYVDGLTETMIVDSQATTDPEDPVLAANPLLLGASVDPDERSPRPPERVFLAGIVGVPWQDIATPATRQDANALEYLDAKGLALPDDALGGKDRWALILGEPGLSAAAPECQGDDPPALCGQEPVPPLDPFMIDSIEPRSGENPLTGDAIVDVGADDWSSINGSEYDNSVLAGDDLPSSDDLQYACIFQLAETAAKVDCTAADASCDCGEEPNKSRPLCKLPGSMASTPPTTTQYWGKAYPAKRLLQVLKGFGDNSIVASICPKITYDPNIPAYGYSPALNAIVERLAGTRGAFCLESSTDWEEPEAGGSCAIVEATEVALDCSREGRAELDDGLALGALSYLEGQGYCSPGGDVPCEDVGLCAITRVDDVEPCFGSTSAEDQPAGYCFIDPAQGPAAGGLGDDCTEDPDTWQDCENPNTTVCSGSPSSSRLLRFVGDSTPVRGSVVFRACPSGE